MNTELLWAISCTAAIAALMLLFEWEYRQHRIRVLRYQLFGLRDRLFEMVSNGDISLTHPAYNSTRKMLNRTIRYADDLSLSRVLVLNLTRRLWIDEGSSERRHAEYQRSVEGLAVPARHTVIEIYREMHFAMLNHMLHIFILTAPIVQAIKFARRITNNYLDVASICRAKISSWRYLENVDDQAEAFITKAAAR